MEAVQETAPEIIADFIFVLLLAAVMMAWSVLFPAKKDGGAWEVRPVE